MYRHSIHECCSGYAAASKLPNFGLDLTNTDAAHGVLVRRAQRRCSRLRPALGGRKEFPMKVELTPEEIETLLLSVEYSKDRVRQSADSTLDARRATLDRLDSAAAKLRNARKEHE